MVGTIANLMIKQKTIMKVIKQNMVKQAIGVGNMKIMKKMKRYQMKVSLTNELIIDKIKNLNIGTVDICKVQCLGIYIVIQPYI